MADVDGTRDRAAALGERIAEAQARLGARLRGDGESVGAVLGTLNDDLDAIVYEDRDDAQRRLNKIEARLVAEELKIEDEKEEREG